MVCMHSNLSNGAVEQIFKQFDGSSANDDIDSKDEGHEGAKYAALFGLLATNTCCSALE